MFPLIGNHDVGDDDAVGRPFNYYYDVRAHDDVSVLYASKHHIYRQ